MAAIISSAYFGSTGHSATSIGHQFVSPWFHFEINYFMALVSRMLAYCSSDDALHDSGSNYSAMTSVYSSRWTVVCALISSMITSIWPTTFAITRYPVIFLPARWLIEPASWATWYWRSVSIGNGRYGGCENFKLQRYTRWTIGYFQEIT